MIHVMVNLNDILLCLACFSVLGPVLVVDVLGTDHLHIPLSFGMAIQALAILIGYPVFGEYSKCKKKLLLSVFNNV